MGEEQEKEQKGKLPCQAYLNHHPVSDRSWLVECDTHCAVLFVLFCFTLKKKKVLQLSEFLYSHQFNSRD